MKIAFVLGLALILGCLLAPSQAPAFDPGKQGVLRTPADPWAHWPPRHNFQHSQRHFDGHKSPSTVIVVPGAAPQAVFVPAQWAWTGWRWVFIPGHWRSL